MDGNHSSNPDCKVPELGITYKPHSHSNLTGVSKKCTAGLIIHCVKAR